MSSSDATKKLGKKELRSLFLRSFSTSHAWHFERQQHMAFCWSMIPAIKKLYDRPEDRIAAYQRHLEFYNCHTTMQPLIGGIVSSISSMKVALMGPLAGIGDSLIGGTLRIIATGIAGGLCMAGSPFGPLLFLLIFNAVNIALRCLGVKYGYGLGENIISKVSDPSTMQKLTCALSIVGLMVIGGMIATNVAITTPIAFDISGTAFSLQDTLDSIFPKLLPVAAFGILYALNKKGVNVHAQISAIMVLGVALGAVGILG